MNRIVKLYPTHFKFVETFVASEVTYTKVIASQYKRHNAIIQIYFKHFNILM